MRAAPSAERRTDFGMVDRYRPARNLAQREEAPSLETTEERREVETADAALTEACRERALGRFEEAVPVATRPSEHQRSRGLARGHHAHRLGERRRGCGIDVAGQQPHLQVAAVALAVVTEPSLHGAAEDRRIGNVERGEVTLDLRRRRNVREGEIAGRRLGRWKGGCRDCISRRRRRRSRRAPNPSLA